MNPISWLKINSLDSQWMIGTVVLQFLTNFAYQTPLTTVLSSVALPMESCERLHVTLEATAACNPFILHLFPAGCVTGECPIMEKPSLMVATKWIFQFGAQNSHGSANHHPVLCRDHVKSEKEMMTFSQQNCGERAMSDIMSNHLSW